jgi:hypothetical protein
MVSKKGEYSAAHSYTIGEDVRPQWSSDSEDVRLKVCCLSGPAELDARFQLAVAE